jgi:hypothetical protein
MEPVSITAVAKLVLDVKKTLDTAALRARVDEIGAAVDALGRHLAETTIAEARSGFSHLEVAVTVTDPQLRSDELAFARQAFNRLASRSADGDDLVDRYAAMSAAHVCALGDLGNYHYFLLRDQPEQALISAYRCTERFPALGVRVLPVGLFSRDWRPVVPDHTQTPQMLRSSFRAAVAEHAAQRRAYRLDMAWRVPAAAGAVLAGLVGATVSPPMAARGAQWAAGILATNEQGLLPSRGPSEGAYLERADAAQKQLDPVVREARQRRLAVQARVSA